MVLTRSGHKDRMQITRWLPNEVLTHIIQLAPRSSQAILSRASKLFHALSLPIVHRTIFLDTSKLDTTVIVAFCDSITRNPERAAATRNLTILFRNPNRDQEQANYGPILNVMKLMVKLADVDLMDWHAEGLSPMCSGVAELTFSDLSGYRVGLKSRDKGNEPSVLSFLARHPNITRLRIGSPWLVVAERDAIVEQGLVQIYRVALAPHKRLPNELLREIFILSAIEVAGESFLPLSTYLNDLVDPRYYSRPQDIRICLTRVSSHWRAVALETHELWAEVKLDYTSDSDLIDRLLTVLDTWFSRSGNLPLSLTITGGALGNPNAQLTERLVRYSQRLRYLDVERDVPLKDFLHQPPGSFDQLESLSLGGTHPDGFWLPEVGYATVFGGAPRLRSIALYQVYGAERMQNLPWHQLQHLNFECSTRAGEFYVFLKECSGLMSAKISLLCIWKQEFLGHEIVYAFPHLRHLALVACDEDQAILFLNTLSLPSLSSLRIEASNRLDVEIPGWTVSFPILRKLSVILNVLQDTSRWIRFWTTVEELYLPEGSLTASLSDGMAAGKHLPNANLLVLHEVDIPAFITMLEARLADPNLSTITHVELRVVKRWDLLPDEVERLVELIGRGVFVTTAHDYGEELPGRTSIEAKALYQYESHLGLFAALEH
ncbi:hypothetical protein FB45DRAFT_1037166 [Roridomyces roridus]|uniref:F-box domain-containing protein n=1 Tax=Roridomyces roridus TaxID=1738132 RepID=A0AAD7B790_9AGAR|nr:hypothetical protein FB45DRAFT_1037166 [Roridomyces roridus]